MFGPSRDRLRGFADAVSDPVRRELEKDLQHGFLCEVGRYLKLIADRQGARGELAGPVRITRYCCGLLTEGVRGPVRDVGAVRVKTDSQPILQRACRSL